MVSDMQSIKLLSKSPEGFNNGRQKGQTKQMSKFIVYFKTGWRFQLVAANGENIAISEPYSSKEAAIRGANAVKRNAPDANIVVQD